MLGEGLAVAVSGLALAAMLAGSGAVEGGGSSGGEFDLADARRFEAFPLYDAGARVEGQPLVAVSRRDDVAEYVSFVYGDCVAADDAGCAPPVEIQVWPACVRNLGLYERVEAGAEAERAEPETVRGVRAATFEGGTRLELETGRSTVVVFAETRGAARRVARELRSLDGSVRANEPLPRPAREEGAMDC